MAVFNYLIVNNNMANPWIQFLTSYRKSHKGMNMKQAMKSAAVEWKKKKGGGGKKTKKKR
jgi:hypothetical protein